jgi:phosphoglycerate kinase
MSDIDVSKLPTTDGIDLVGKRVLIRADLNVPMADGEVTDATRIERFLPTLKELADRGAKVIVLSHFGRPKGQRSPETSLRPIAEKMSELMGGGRVGFVPDIQGEEAERAVSALRNGEIAVLENVRYDAGEEKNDRSFAEKLARLGDIYVNDAFSCAHRAHASTEAIARLLPAYAGPSLMAEIEALSSALTRPERPVAAIVGGAKVSTKIPVLTNLAGKVDTLVIGGGMANTFLYAQGVKVGKSLCEPDFKDMAREVMAAAEASGCRIALPLDVVVAGAFRQGAASRTVGLDEVPDDMMILDVGAETVKDLKSVLADSATLLWNGPLGAFEISPFGDGTFALAREAARLSKAGKLISVAGGGDTVAALNAAGVADDFTYVSTAGGAFLEWLEGRDLPGVVALIRH